MVRAVQTRLRGLCFAGAVFGLGLLAPQSAWATAPVIIAQPASAVVRVGMPASLTVTPSGTVPFGYQWIKDGVILSGQTNATLTYASFQFTNSGSYYVVITNSLGMAISIPASLSVSNAPLKAWGYNNDGQLGNGTTTNTNLPITVTNSVVATATGSAHSLIVMTDGTLWGMGNNYYGQLGNGTTTSTNRPIFVTNNVVAIAAGWAHSLFVKADGTLWVMGYNYYGQLGNGRTTSTNLPIYVTNNVVATAAGADHSLLVKADGTLWGMGLNDAGELGNGTTTNTNRPIYVTNNVVATSAGVMHTLFVKADGTLWGMGYNAYGQLGNGNTTSTNLPILVTNNVVATAAGEYHSLFVKADGTLCSMGYNDDGALGNGTTTSVNLPVQVNGGGLLAAGLAKGDLAYHALAIAGAAPVADALTNQTVTIGQPASFTASVSAGDGPFTYQWQWNGASILNATNAAYTMASVALMNAGSYTVIVTGPYGSATASATLTVNRATPTITTWPVASAITYGQTLATSALTGGVASVGGTFAFTLPGLAPVAGTAAQSVTFTPTDMNDYTIVNGSVTVTVNQAVATVTFGNLTQTYTGAPEPVTVNTMPAGLAVTVTYNGSASAPVNAGSYTVIGTVVDANYAGSATNTLVILPAPPAITAQPVGAVVGVGQSASLSVTNSGSAPFGYQWLKDGVILAGQTNSTLSFSSFQFINSGSYSVVITNAAGLAISIPASLSVPNAPLRGWGENGDGELGNGTTTNTNLPITVTNNVVATAAGGSHSLVVKADGTLWVMGANAAGQLGNGTTTNTNRPIYVTNNVVAVAAGDLHSLFVKTDGTLWAMGANAAGQLGNGTTTDTNRPVYVTNNVVAVAAGELHSLFVKVDGTLWGMGYNGDGELGNGTTTSTNRPIYVTNNVVATAAGVSHSLFVKADGTLWTMGGNYYGQFGNGTSDGYTPNPVPVYVTNNVVATVAGGFHSLFVKADGTLWTMGWNNVGQLGNGTTADSHVPAYVTNNVVAAAAGYLHSLFVKADGSLWAMGYNGYGELGNDTTSSFTNLPVQVNNGGLLTAGLAKGGNAYHVLAIAGAVPVVNALTIQTVFAGQLAGFTASVSAGDGPFTYQWQWNGTNILNATNAAYTITSAVVSNAGTYSVVVTGPYGSATASATLTVNRATPSVTTWPMASAITYGQTLAASSLGSGGASVGGSFAFTTPTLAPPTGTAAQGVTFTPTDTNDYTTVTGYASVTVNPATPSVTTWPIASAITYGQTLAASALTGGVASVGGTFAFTLPGLAPVAGAAAQGVAFTPTDTTDYTVVNGSVTVTVNQAVATVTLGNLTQTYTGAAESVTVNTTPAGLTVTVTYNGSASVPVNAGSYTVIGTVVDANYAGSATNTLVILPAPPSITAQPVGAVVGIGQSATLSVTNNGSAPFGYQWLKDGVILAGRTNSTLNFSSFQFTNSGSYYVAIRNAAGLAISIPASLSVPNAPLRGWGENGDGELGNGTTTNTNLPITVTNNVVAVAASCFSLLVKADGTLWAMGYNLNGQLGNGTTTNTNRPVFVTNNVVAVAAGDQHSLFVKADGTLWAMGNNYSGELGNGTTTNTNRPVFVTNNVVAVAAGGGHSLFVKADGTLWAIGFNFMGQLGNGTTTDQHNPVYVTNNVVAVAAGDLHSLFVKADGTLWAMGANGYGQLGNGKTTDTNLPVFVTNNVVATAAGAMHSSFVRADGTLWTMGNNDFGQLGNGTTTSTNLPVCVTNNVVTTVAGDGHSLFVKTDGTLWAMGPNGEGQLGNGNWAQQNSPVLVNNGGLLTAGLAKGCGANGALAIAGAVPVVNALTNQTVIACQPAGFTASVSAGDGPFTYQWQWNGTNILNATNAAYSILSVVVSNAGTYSVTVTGPFGSATASATLTVMYTLTIQSGQGTASPLPGVYANPAGSVLTNTVTSPNQNGATQYVCSGWSMVGNDPANGATNQCVMILTNNAVLTWSWTTNYWLATAAGTHGSVNVASGWQAMGITTTITATAVLYYHFANWTGSVSSFANPLNLPMTGPQTVTANFAATMTSSSPVPVPYWWLAQYGWTNNFETIVTNAANANGMPWWAEYVAGTDPENPASVFAITGLLATPDGDNIVTWPSVAGRVYGLDFTTNLLQAFAPVPGAAALPATPPVNVYTNTLETWQPRLFYRMRVWLAP